MSLRTQLTQSHLFLNRSLLIIAVIAVLLHIGLWVYVATAAHPREAIVPLHYNIYFGIDLFAEWYNIFWLPASGTLILVVNTIAMVTILRTEKILTGVAAVTTLMVQCALLASAYFIFSQIYYS